MDLKPYLDLASRDHKHLCPRQVLGVRIGLKGMSALGLDEGSSLDNLLVIFETDGCFLSNRPVRSGSFRARTIELISHTHSCDTKGRKDGRQTNSA